MRSIALIVAAALAIGCSGSSTEPSGLGGTLNLLIKDSPYSEAKSLLVTFDAVGAHRDGEANFTTLPFADQATERTCDLKKLVTAHDVLGVGVLPEGHYTQLRLHVSRATLYFENESSGPACAPSIETPLGRREIVEIPNGEVKLNRQFQVRPEGATTILLDFDGDRSVVQLGTGTYRMTPVITIVSVQ